MPASGRPFARWLLAGMILAIALGPRIRLPGFDARAIDLRVQDFLIVVAVAYLGTRLPSLRAIWGRWAALFLASATALIAARLLLDPSLPLIRMVAFFGRAAEIFLLAVAVAGLYRLAGDRAQKAALRAALFSVAANALWVGYQYATGTQTTLIGATVADQLTAYGPRLVGEGSAFGAGFFFVFTTALGVALFRLPSVPRWQSAPVVAVGLVGAYLSGSRLSLVAAIVCLVMIVLSPRPGGKPNYFTAVAAAVAAIVIVPLVPEAGRLSEAGIAHGLSIRVDLIWGPLWQALWEQPLIGIGPGQLGTATYRWTEAHNVALRAALDYGIIIGAIYLAVFVTVLLRTRRDATDPSAPPDQQMWATLAALLVVAAFVGGMVQETLTVVMSTHLLMLAVGLYAGAKLGPVSPGGRASRLPQPAARPRPPSVAAPAA